MTPVFQTIISNVNGNCMQAAIASLFDEKLEDVPNFIEFGEACGYRILRYMLSKGHAMGYFDNRNNEEFLKVLHFDGGVNGYFYATVNSLTYQNSYHAVIIDIDGNVVHDPNPNGKCLGLKIDSIVQIMTTKTFYVKDGTIHHDYYEPKRKEKST